MEKNIDVSRNSGVASKGWGLRVDQPDLQPYVGIWRSEVQFMCGVASRWRNIETGGEVYGFISHAGRPVIMLVTPPGPKAIHRVAQFTQDLDFFKETDAFLRNNVGLQYEGSWHSHHHLDIEGLSPGDIHSTNAIALKNGYRRLAQFVLTFGYEYSPNLDSRSNQVFCGKGSVETVTESKTNFICIHSFFYPDAARGKPVRCPIRIIPGTSPFRRAVMRSSMIPELARPYSFPRSRILFDSFSPPPEPGNHDREVPERISNEFLQLPEDLREKTRVAYKEGLVVLSLPLSLTRGIVFVAYNEKPPHGVEAVYFCQNGKADTPIDLRKKVLWSSPYTGLTKIYERAVRLVGGSAGWPDKSGETGEMVKPNGGTSKEEAINNREESARIGREEVL
jgi:hypothetical protein